MTIDEETIDLINDFIRETETSLEAIDESILNLKQYIFPIQKDFDFNMFITHFRGLNVPQYLESIQSINRVVHTIKGISAFIDLNVLNAYCHKTEELTLDLANGKIFLNKTAYNIIESLPNILNRFIEKIKEEYVDKGIDVEKEILAVESCRNELINLMGTEVIHFDELSGKDMGRIRESRKALKVTIDFDKYNKLLNKFQAFSQDSLSLIKDSEISKHVVNEINKGFTEHLDGLIMSAQSEMMLSRYPRIVTDLGSTMGKNINLVVIRNDAMAAPDVWDKCHNALVHIVRNAVDHGIESIKDREINGKSPEGSIEMSIYEDFKNIYISIVDDGAGIDADKVSKIALSKGIISNEELKKMSIMEKQKLIFRPGFSTKESATEVSGRGVGMDAVHKEIEINLNGHIFLESTVGFGTSIMLEIPKNETLSECIVFGDEKHIYGIPVVDGIEFLECNPKFINRVLGKTTVYTEGDLELPIINLFKHIHKYEYNKIKMDFLPIIKIGSGKSAYGLVVPGIKGHERINIDRRKNIKKAVLDEGIVFGYGLTDPITTILDLDYISNLF